DLESRLLPFSFFRIHKSYLVNLDYVTRLTPWFNGAYQLEMEGREELLSVSRNYVKALRVRLEL
ncbi:LytTR family DNA-binding domain-containing protein, partial [Escherichia coli]|nr:LytTR family DNA-binding domain-containing protein [Escherichia coli]